MRDHQFVAINYIECSDDYKPRFEELFATRKGAIDRMQGFRRMEVLKPVQDDSAYLIVSYWESEDDFNGWTKSEAFIEGHKRGFKDLSEAKKAGKPVPMKSTFRTYEVIAR